MESTRSCERVNHSIVQRLLNEAGNNTIFYTIVMSACGAIGPSMVACLKEVYGRTKEVDKFLMSRQPALKHSRQPHPDPNYAPRCRRLEDQAWRVVVAIPGARSSMQPLVLLTVRRFN
jgi:hypothetical protein